MQNGAIPIMPHQCLTKTKGQDLYNLIKYLKKNGLMGIEVFHSEHTPAQMKEYFEIGQIVNTSGLKGILKIFTEETNRILN